MFDGTRDPWSYDDSANYLKHALCQIEVERQHAIAIRYDRDGELRKYSIADPWKPLKELTHNLLPHLEFVKIDTANQDQVKCIFSVHSKNVMVDLDELTSGEKSIVQMFHPLIERDIKARLKGIEAATSVQEQPELCVLIDEPELHLHPNLQLKVLDYLRVLTSGEKTQVIIATHSPTMVEYASFEELFLLRPIELVDDGGNQLVRIATDEERLRFLRDVYGTTSNLTAMQPVIIVEGIKEKDASKIMPDRKLYRALHHGFDSVTLIPGGGKGECKALLNVLNEAMAAFSPRLRAIALLDRDNSPDSNDSRIHLLPVAMIENFLIDPDSIWEAIQSVVERTTLQTVDDVETAIDQLLDRIEGNEIERNAISRLGITYFRPQLPLEEILNQVSTFVPTVLERYSEPNVSAAIADAQSRVVTIRQSNRRREDFHGKTIVGEFYKEHLSQSGLAKVVFTFETARHARRRRAVVQYFDDFFQKLMFPGAT